MRVEQQSHSSLPELQLALWQWLEELRPDRSLPLESSEVTFGLTACRHDLDNGVLASRQHDFLAGFGERHELGQVRLGRMDRVGRRARDLARLLS